MLRSIDGSMHPVLAVAACVAASVVGDSSFYAVLPVFYAARGLEPFQVGMLLSANRWVRLLTNKVAERLLARQPVRAAFAAALLVSGLTTLTYASTRSFRLLALARLSFGACWSVIRLAGLLILTDSVEAGIVPEENLGRMTGLYVGVHRLGVALGMVAGGIVCDALGFDFVFYLTGLVSLLAAPLAYTYAFGNLPRVSTTAAHREDERRAVAVAAAEAKPSPPRKPCSGPSARSAQRRASLPCSPLPHHAAATVLSSPHLARCSRRTLS